MKYFNHDYYSNRKRRWKEKVERDLHVLGVRRWRELAIDRKKLFDRPKPTAGCSANGRRRYTYYNIYNTTKLFCDTSDHTLSAGLLSVGLDTAILFWENCCLLDECGGNKFLWKRRYRATFQKASAVIFTSASTWIIVWNNFDIICSSHFDRTFHL